MKRLLTTAITLLTLGYGFLAQAQVRQIELGSTGLVGRSERTAIIQVDPTLKFERLVFQAIDDHFKVTKAIIQYDNGSREELFSMRDLTIEEGDSRAFRYDLSGKSISSITISGYQARFFGTRTQLKVFGILAPKLQKMQIGDTGLIGRSLTTREFLLSTADQQKAFRRITFHAVDDSFYIYSLVIYFTNGSSQSLIGPSNALYASFTIPEGDQSNLTYYNLSGENIDRIVVRGNQGRLFGTKARLIVYGHYIVTEQPPQPTEIKVPELTVNKATGLSRTLDLAVDASKIVPSLPNIAFNYKWTVENLGVKVAACEKTNVPAFKCQLPKDGNYKVTLAVTDAINNSKVVSQSGQLFNQKPVIRSGIQVLNTNDPSTKNISVNRASVVDDGKIIYYSWDVRFKNRKYGEDHCDGPSQKPELTCEFKQEGVYTIRMWAIDDARTVSEPVMLQYTFKNK